LLRAQASIAAFRRYLDTDVGKTRGPDRASALLDKGTLITQASAGTLSPDLADEAEAALREAAEVFRGDRQQLAQLNLAAFLGTHRLDRSASLGDGESLLRGLLKQKLPASYAFNAQRNLGSILFKKQTGNHQKNLTEAIMVLDTAYASVSPRDKVTWIKIGISLALTLEASGVGAPKNLERAKKILEELLATADAADMTREAAEIIETLVSVRMHRLALGEDENLDNIGAQLTRAERLSAGAPQRSSPILTTRCPISSANVSRWTPRPSTRQSKNSSPRAQPPSTWPATSEPAKTLPTEPHGAKATTNK